MASSDPQQSDMPQAGEVWVSQRYEHCLTVEIRDVTPRYVVYFSRTVGRLAVRPMDEFMRVFRRGNK